MYGRRGRQEKNCAWDKFTQQKLSFRVGKVVFRMKKADINGGKVTSKAKRYFVLI